MATVLVAVLGVFIVLSIWVSVDLAARKMLGERQHGCRTAQGFEGHHHRHGGPECVGCQALDACTRDDED